MKIPGELFDQFYEPLVGTDVRAANLRDRLADVVNAPSDIQPTNPFDRLEMGSIDAVVDAASQIDSDHTMTQTMTQKWVARIRDTGAMGVGLAVASLRTVGDIYTDGASVPQQPERVAKTADRAVRMVFGMAFSGKTVGGINIGALRAGVNPRNPLTQPLISVALASARIKGDFRVSRRAFRVAADDAGQLTIQPRYARTRSLDGSRCPASFPVVEAGGKQKSGLATLLGTIGDVALTEIYPRQFDVAEAANQP